MWIPVLIATYFLSEYIGNVLVPPDTGVIVAAWWIPAAMALQALSSIYGGIQAGKAAKVAKGASDDASTRADEQLSRTESAIGDFRSKFMDVAPGQLDYMERLREQTKRGVLPVGQLISRVSQRANEQANVGAQRVRGETVSAGLGGAATASAVGRLQSKTIQTIAEQAQAIQIENELSKLGASDKLGQIGLGETSAGRQMEIAALNANIGAGSTYNADALRADALGVSAANQTAQANAAMVSSIAGAGSDFANYASARTTTFEGQKYRWFNGQWIKD